jgi:hypothetical protein
VLVDSVESRVEFGIDQFSNDRTVEVPLRDLLYAFKTIGEFIGFFEQPANYPDLASVETFLGDVDHGGLHVLGEAYYRRLRDVWPADVQQAFDEGTLDKNPFLDAAG